jgi:alpha(1,3/1,4) fucosyltransferase
MNISFADFWGDGFDPNNNFFVDLLQSISPKYKIVPFSNEHTDVLIYSCFGDVHRTVDRSKVKKIYFTGENIRPNFNECDYSLTFDFPDYGGKNIRLPIWLFQIAWFGKTNYGNPKYVIPPAELRVSRFHAIPKTEFCCFVFNKPIPNRIEIVQKLSKYKPVHVYGKLSGNHFYGEDEKYKILSNFKFNICFENSLTSGYYTEKLIHAKVAGCLPLYWGDEECKQDFNTNSFLNLNDFPSMDAFIERIIELDQNEEAYNAMSSQYLFEGKEPSLEGLKIQVARIL